MTDEQKGLSLQCICPVGAYKSQRVTFDESSLKSRWKSRNFAVQNDPSMIVFFWVDLSTKMATQAYDWLQHFWPNCEAKPVYEMSGGWLHQQIITDSVLLRKIQKSDWLIPETKWHSCLHNRALCSYLATLRLLRQRENNTQFSGTY